MDIISGSFVWDDKKEFENILKHGVNFSVAAQAFFDSERKIFIDHKHGQAEERLFCIGKVDGKILTVRFTYRNDRMRIIGAEIGRAHV